MSRPRCEPHGAMLWDIGSGYYCPECGATTAVVREPSVLEERALRLPTRMIALMGARAATHTWRSANEQDAKEYEQDNPLREKR